MAAEKVTAASIRARKARAGAAEKIAVLTAYDATFARLFDSASIDMLLVGDTLGMVVQGAANTLSVTVEDVIYHTRAVARGTSRAMIVADMPFMSYQVSVEGALTAAGRLVKEAREDFGTIVASVDLNMTPAKYMHLYKAFHEVVTPDASGREAFGRGATAAVTTYWPLRS